MNRNRAPAYALVFAAALPHLQNVARQHGYTLAVHGSMSTDLDLIAVPWTEDAADAPALIESLRSSVNGFIRNAEQFAHNPAWKPHGRLAWSIYTGPTGGAPYLDISVMPRRRPGDHYDHE